MAQRWWKENSDDEKKIHFTPCTMHKSWKHHKSAQIHTRRCCESMIFTPVQLQAVRCCYRSSSSSSFPAFSLCEILFDESEREAKKNHSNDDESHVTTNKKSSSTNERWIHQNNNSFIVEGTKKRFFLHQLELTWSDCVEHRLHTLFEPRIMKTNRSERLVRTYLENHIAPPRLFFEVVGESFPLELATRKLSRPGKRADTSAAISQRRVCARSVERSEEISVRANLMCVWRVYHFT